MDEGADDEQIADRLTAIRRKLARMREEGRVSLERLSASREAADHGRAAAREAVRRDDAPAPPNL
jgi:hypothetical protein